MPESTLSIHRNIYIPKRKPRVGDSIANPAHPLTRGLLGAWAFNEGGLPNNAGPNANYLFNGIYPDIFAVQSSSGNWPTWEYGQYGAQLRFTGTSGTDRFQTIKLLTGVQSRYTVQAHTVALWVRTASITSSSAGGSYSLISRSNDILAGGWEWALSTTPNHFAFAYYDGSVEGWYNDTATLSNNTNYFLVGTWSPAGTVSFYVNGLLSSSTSTTTSNVTYSGSDELQLGFQSNSGTLQNSPFEGAFQQVLIYNRMLDAKEIAELYAEPFAIYKPRIPLYQLFPPTTAQAVWIPFPNRNNIAQRTAQIQRYERLNRIKTRPPFRQAIYGQWPQGTITSGGTIVNRANKVLTGVITSAGTLLTQAFQAIPYLLTHVRSTYYKVAAPNLRFPPRTRIKFVIPRAGAVLNTQSNSGTITSSATIVNRANKILAGTVTSSGTLVKAAAKAFTGTISTISGTLVKQARKVFTGLLVESGVLATAKVAVLALAGTITSSGTLVKRASKILVGVITSSGAIIQRASKMLSGAINSSGALLTTKAFVRQVSGTITSSGAIVRRTNKVLTAQILPSASITNFVRKFGLAGTVTSSGTVARVRVIVRAFTGTLTSAATLTNRVFKVLPTASLPLNATLGFIKPIRLTGSILMTASLTKAVAQSLRGLISTITSTIDNFAHHGAAVSATPEYIAYELPLATYEATDHVLIEYETTDKVLV